MIELYNFSCNFFSNQNVFDFKNTIAIIIIVSGITTIYGRYFIDKKIYIYGRYYVNRHPTNVQ